MPEKSKLRIDEIFTSKTNSKITKKLIPELLKSMASQFSPTKKQLWNWLGALHRHQRGRFLQKESGKILADNRRIHINSRANEVYIYIFYFFCRKHQLFLIFTGFYRKKHEELKVYSYFLNAKQNELRNIIKTNYLDCFQTPMCIHPN